MLKNKKGTVTVEATILITVILVIFTSFFQTISLYFKEDIISQKVFDSLYTLDNVSYFYEKVGISKEIENLSINEDLENIFKNQIDELKSVSVNSSKEIILREVFKNKLKNIDESLKLIAFSLNDDIIYSDVYYKRKLIFNELDFHIKIQKKLFLFGDEKELFKNKTIIDIVKELAKNQEENGYDDKFVYMTKYGKVYHTNKNCFYLVKDGTIHEAITKKSLKEMKEKGIRECKLCGGLCEGK